MLIKGQCLPFETLQSYGKSVPALVVLTELPSALIKIALDENYAVDNNLVGKEIQVGIDINAYRDKVQYTCSVEPKLLSATPNPSPQKA